MSTKPLPKVPATKEYIKGVEHAVKISRRSCCICFFYFTGYWFTLSAYLAVATLCSAAAGEFFITQASADAEKFCNYSQSIMSNVSPVARSVVIASYAAGAILLWCDRPKDPKGKDNRLTKYRFHQRNEYDRIKWSRVLALCSSLFLSIATLSNDVVVWYIFSAEGFNNNYYRLPEGLYAGGCVAALLFIFFYLIHGGRNNIPDEKTEYELVVEKTISGAV